MKDFLQTIVVLTWFAGLCLMIYGVVSNNIACSVSGAGMFIGVEIRVLEGK